LITRSQIKFIRNLRFKKHRIKHQCFVVEGEKIVSELLSSNFEIIELYAVDQWICIDKKLVVNYISNNQLQSISTLKSPNKVLAIVKNPDLGIIKNTNITLVLDSIRDPGNLGTIIRVCDWFSVNKIVCSLDTTDVFSPKVIQATMGSIFRVHLQYLDLEEYFKKIDEPIYGAFIEGQNIKNVKIEEKAHLVLGNESNGISKPIANLINNRISIFKKGKNIDSLNVAIATGIMLHEFSC